MRELFTEGLLAALALAAALARGGCGEGAAGLDAERFTRCAGGEAIDDCFNPHARVAHVENARIFRRHVGIAFRAAGQGVAERRRVDGRAVAPIRDAEGVRGMRRRGERDGDEEGARGFL